MYVSARHKLDVGPVSAAGAKRLEELTGGGRRVGIVTTAQHQHKLQQMGDAMKAAGFEPLVGAGDNRLAGLGQLLGCNYTAGTSIDWNPVWSPDGRYLYFASDRSGVTNLWRLPIDERSGRVLGEPEPVPTSGQASLLSLSRDGRHIVYTSDETRTVLEKAAFDPARGVIGGSAAAIAQTAGLIPTIDTSRDGRWLVYQTFTPQEDLFVVHSDGTGLRRLTNDEFKDRQPRWSPDGRRIAFYSNRGGKYEIWTLRADGSELARAAVTPGRLAYHPIWSPDGDRLACDLGENEALIDLTRPAAQLISA